MLSPPSLKSVEVVPWSINAERGLVVSAGNDMASIKKEVEAGISLLWQVIGDNIGGYVVTRVDDDELVIVCGEGRGLIEHTAPFFLSLAKRHNLGVRTHVKRKGLIRIWKRYGLALDEYVLRGMPSG